MESKDGNAQRECNVNETCLSVVTPRAGRSRSTPQSLKETAVYDLHRGVILLRRDALSALSRAGNSHQPHAACGKGGFVAKQTLRGAYAWRSSENNYNFWPKLP
eukprot:6198622-Pleurochrysis_carterae.AAC.1